MSYLKYEIFEMAFIYIYWHFSYVGSCFSSVFYEKLSSKKRKGTLKSIFHACMRWMVSHEQHSKFVAAASKCQGFCRGISPFYSICLGNKNAKAVKFLEI